MSEILPIELGSDDDAKGFLGQRYFYGPVTLTNTGEEDLTGLSLVIDRFQPSNEGMDWKDYFNVVYTPDNFSLKAKETKFVSFVYEPKMVSMPDYDNTNWWYLYVNAKDANGNKSQAIDPVHTVFVMPEEKTDITQAFLQKWKEDQTKNEYTFSYKLTLTSEAGTGARVYDWYIFMNLPDGARVSPAWLETMKDWVHLSGQSTPVSNTVLVSPGDGSHTIDPGNSIDLDIEIIYPGDSAAYETLENLALNYKWS
jgi:hypothetical protein